MMVVDASLLTAALADRGAVGAGARRRLGSVSDLRSPDLINTETLSALRSMLRRQEISAAVCARAIAGLREVSILRVTTHTLINRIAELHENVTAYDATYVALAEALGCPMLTIDRRLANAPGPRCDFELI